MSYAITSEIKQDIMQAPEPLFALFQKLNICQNLTPINVKLIFKNMSYHSYLAGETLYTAGKTSQQELFLILSGHVSASDQNGYQYITLSSGEVFGLFSFLDEERFHSATIKAESDLQVMRLSRASFDRIANYQPMLESVILRFMFRLLSKTTLKIEHEYAAIHEYALGRKV